MGSSRFIYRSGLNGFILLLLTARFINPLNPDVSIGSILCDHVRNSHDPLFYKAVILQGEIGCWSLLGLKGLILLEIFRCTTMSLCMHDAMFIYGIRPPRPLIAVSGTWDRCQSEKIYFVSSCFSDILWILSWHLTLSPWNLSRMFDVWIT